MGVEIHRLFDQVFVNSSPFGLFSGIKIKQVSKYDKNIVLPLLLFCFLLFL